MGACQVNPGSTCSLCPPAAPYAEPAVSINDFLRDMVLVLTDDVPATLKENTVSVVTITKHTEEANTRRVSRLERQLKNAVAGRDKTRVEVSAHTYADEPYGSLYVQVPSENPNEDGQYVSVVMNEADLLALETAIFDARSKVVKAKAPKRVSDAVKF